MRPYWIGHLVIMYVCNYTLYDSIDNFPIVRFIFNSYTINYARVCMYTREHKTYNLKKVINISQ